MTPIVWTSTVRDASFDLLRGYGMTTIFGNVGATEQPFLQDLPAEFEYVLGLQRGLRDPEVVRGARRHAWRPRPRSAGLDIVSRAKGYGCDTVRVEDADAFKHAVASAWTRDVPTVLEVPVVPEISPLV